MVFFIIHISELSPTQFFYVNLNTANRKENQQVPICSIFTDVAAEKSQKSLFDGIEKFDATRLKHTETQEKNPLPDKDGNPLSLITHSALDAWKLIFIIAHCKLVFACYVKFIVFQFAVTLFNNFTVLRNWTILNMKFVATRTYDE